MNDLKVQTDPSKIDWDGLEMEVIRKIRYLKATAYCIPGNLGEKFVDDLILPNVKLLAQFCANIEEVD